MKRKLAFACLALASALVSPYGLAGAAQESWSVTLVSSHAREAMLVTPGDPHALAAALVEILDNPASRRRLSRNGRALARGYTWRARAESILDFAQNVVATSGRTAV